MWRANLKLHECWLVMVEKQVAQHKHLIGAVQALMAALSCSMEESGDEDIEGEGEGSGGGDD